MASNKLPLVSLTLLVSALSAHAGDAVSSLNGKLGFSYGDYDSDNGGTLTGSFAVPVAPNYGAQFDGLYSHVAGNDFYGAGSHFFWRDSAKGLIGLAAAGANSNFVRTLEGGVEAESYYFSWLTPGAYAGYSNINYRTSSPLIDTNYTEPFGTVYLGIYPIPNLMIRPNYTRKLANNLYGVEVEYELPVYNLALTAEASRGSHGFEQTQFGVRYYFGGKKPLKARHREDDPINLAPGAFAAVGTYGAKYNERVRDYLATPPAIGGQNNYSGTITSTGGTLTLGNSGVLVNGGTYGSANTLVLNTGASINVGALNLNGITLPETLHSGDRIGPYTLVINSGVLTLQNNNVYTLVQP